MIKINRDLLMHSIYNLLEEKDLYRTTLTDGSIRIAGRQSPSVKEFLFSVKEDRLTGIFRPNVGKELSFTLDEHELNHIFYGKLSYFEEWVTLLTSFPFKCFNDVLSNQALLRETGSECFIYNKIVKHLALVLHQLEDLLRFHSDNRVEFIRAKDSVCLKVNTDLGNKLEIEFINTEIGFKFVVHQSCLSEEDAHSVAELGGWCNGFDFLATHPTKVKTILLDYLLKLETDLDAHQPVKYILIREYPTTL